MNIAVLLLWHVIDSQLTEYLLMWDNFLVVSIIIDEIPTEKTHVNHVL